MGSILASVMSQDKSGLAQNPELSKFEIYGGNRWMKNGG